MAIQTAKRPAAKKRKAAAGRQKPLIVELGNVGYMGEPNAERMLRIAKKMPGTIIVGVDRKPLQKKTPKNAVQITASFSTGLSTLKNNSVSAIYSNLALGHYMKEARVPLTVEGNRPVLKHTRETLKAAYKKLKKGGKLKIVGGKTALNIVLEASRGTGFRKENIGHWPISKKRTGGSFWTRNYAGELHRIVLEK